jgi:hypothetical protein
VNYNFSCFGDVGLGAQPRNRAVRDIEHPRNLARRLARVAAFDRLSPLVSLARVDVVILGAMLPGSAFTRALPCCRHGGA